MTYNFPTQRLDSIVERVCVGFVGSCNKHYTDAYNGVPMIRTTNLTGHQIDLGDVKYISREFHQKNRKSQLKRGDILVARHGDNGLPSIVTANDEMNCLNVVIVKPHQDDSLIDSYFLLYALKSPFVIQQIKSAVGGSVQGVVNTKAIAELQIPYPERNVREQIVNNLLSIDTKLINNVETNQTLEEMAQAIFKSWFVDFDPVKAKMNGEQPEGMDAATASLFPEKLVESELGLIPEGWPVDQVGKHIDVTKGKSYKSAELQESTTALVTLKSFKRGGGYRMDGLKEYTGKYKPQQVIEAGDLVMSLTDVTQAAEIVGKPALVIDAPQYDTLVASLDVAILRPKETNAKQYFYGLMSTYRFHRYAESFATGTTVLHLSPKGITTFEFACPSAELVKKYHEFAAPIFAKIEANILESQELAKLRDTLLPKLLSGEIELGETEEMAEVN
ncbi:TPA: restriction endonuclease subunit S [Vibrio parahaemolyticus]